MGTVETATVQQLCSSFPEFIASVQIEVQMGSHRSTSAVSDELQVAADQYDAAVKEKKTVFCDAYASRKEKLHCNVLCAPRSCCCLATAWTVH
jgi:hypothetical protein